MDKVSDVHFGPLTDSKYVRPLRFNYTQDGVKKNWDLLDSHDSVAIFLFNVTRKKVIFVKQFRPTVYFTTVMDKLNKDKTNKVIDTDKFPGSLGVTLELCAGIVDKQKSLEEIACEEVEEECGYKVQPANLEKIVAFRGDVGAQGGIQVLYYCEVTDEMKVGPGGGVDSEMIEVVEMSIDEMEKLVTEPKQLPIPSPPAFLFAITWFLHFKANKYRETIKS